MELNLLIMTECTEQENTPTFDESILVDLGWKAHLSVVCYQNDLYLRVVSLVVHPLYRLSLKAEHPSYFLVLMRIMQHVCEENFE